MPKQTLFNLPEDKRNKIIKAGVNEFSVKGYREASINTIVNDAGIPKGSFYQYFHDKKDMFKYICGLVGDEKIRYMGPVMSEISKMNFFDVYKTMYSIGIRFGKEHPEYFRISNDLLEDAELRTEVFGEQMGRAEDFLSDFLRSGIEKGDIRADLDIGFITKMLMSLSLSMGEYFLDKYKDGDFEELERYSEKFIDLIKNGIAGGNRNDHC